MPLITLVSVSFLSCFKMNDTLVKFTRQLSNLSLSDKIFPCLLPTDTVADVSHFKHQHCRPSLRQAHLVQHFITGQQTTSTLCLYHTAKMPRSKPSGRSRTKRKAAESTRRQMIKRNKTEKKPFRFLDLPGELRNLVYEEVAQQQSVVLCRGRL